MSMKLSQLTTHWSADDAHLVLSFLDELSEVLWATYGPGIIEQQQREHQTLQTDPKYQKHPNAYPPDERQLPLSPDWQEDPF